jgi:pseudouridine-5'-phosphate glycosidase
MNEAEVEHKSAKQLIQDLERMQSSDPMYAATFTVLGEYIDHHVEEEEGEMFKKARKAKVDLRALGEQIAARKAARGG